MVLTTTSDCLSISATTPTTELLDSWYAGTTLDVDVTWNLNNCTDTTVKFPNRYPFTGVISNCTKLGGSASHQFLLNITGITVANVDTITLTTNTGTVSVVQTTTLSWTVVVLDADIAVTDAVIGFTIVDINGDEYTVTYTIEAGAVPACANIAINNTVSTYPDLPCGIEYNSSTDTMTFFYPFFYGGDCDVTDVALTCGVYNITIGTEPACIFVCCELACLGVEVFTLEDLTEKLDVWQAMMFLNELNAAGDTCTNCNQMVEIYSYLRTLVNVNSNGSSDCGCG